MLAGRQILGQLEDVVIKVWSHQSISISISYTITTETIDIDVAQWGGVGVESTPITLSFPA